MGAPAAAPPLHERLASFSRYVALVADQIAALEAGAGVRARELGDARAELEEELGDVPALLREALQVIEERLQSDELLRDRWRSLQDDAFRITRTLPPKGPRKGRYLEDRADAGRLDLRL